MKKQKIGLVSLGCPKNLVDSEVMTGRLTRAGYEFTSREEEADLILINTCGFIETAKEESIDTILSFTQRRARGDLKGLVVTGCLAQRYADELGQEISEVDRFVPIKDEARIAEIVDHILSPETATDKTESSSPASRTLLTPFHTAYLKISEGCNNHCSYCAIPLIRGPLGSRQIPELLSEADGLCSNGVREIILIGQDICLFGSDRGHPKDLIPLLKGLSEIQELAWIRLLYLHPGHLFEELAELMSLESKIVPYLDLPIQHVNPKILWRMNRTGSGEILRDQIQRLREAIPDLVLRTTVMVGFPGETDHSFQELYDFVQEIRFDHLGVFAYSPEEQTPAAGLADQVDDDLKTQRRDTILQLQAQIAREKNQERVGTTLQVLVEGTSPETDLLLAGRYYGQAPEIDGLVLINKGNAVTGTFAEVLVTEAHTYDLVGEITGGQTTEGRR